MSKVKFEELEEFKKDCKKLLKKYRSLEDDLRIVKLDLNDEPGESPPFSYRLEGLRIGTCVIKVKKIACKSLKGRGVNSGLRLIYAWYETEQRLVFIEIYHKSDKENEDKERILRNFE